MVYISVQLVTHVYKFPSGPLLTANIEGMYYKHQAARRPAIGIVTKSFLYWMIKTPYFNRIRSTVGSECAESTEWETDALANLATTTGSCG